MGGAPAPGGYAASPYGGGDPSAYAQPGAYPGGPPPGAYSAYPGYQSGYPGAAGYPGGGGKSSSGDIGSKLKSWGADAMKALGLDDATRAEAKRKAEAEAAAPAPAAAANQRGSAVVGCAAAARIAMAKATACRGSRRRKRNPDGSGRRRRRRHPHRPRLARRQWVVSRRLSKLGHRVAAAATGPVVAARVAAATCWQQPTGIPKPAAAGTCMGGSATAGRTGVRCAFPGRFSELGRCSRPAGAAAAGATDASCGWRRPGGGSAGQRGAAIVDFLCAACPQTRTSLTHSRPTTLWPRGHPTRF